MSLKKTDAGVGARFSMLKELIYKGIAHEPFFRHWRKSRLRGCIVVLTYHELGDDKDDIEAWTVIQKSRFVEQIEYLRRHFEVISLSEAVARMNQADENGVPAVVITFDDGDSGNHRILLPLIKSFALPVAIFVATKQLEEQAVFWFDRLINVVQGRGVLRFDLRDRGLSEYRVNHRHGPRNWNEIERLLADLKCLAPDVREETVEHIIRLTGEKPEDKAAQISPLSIVELKELGLSPFVTIGSHSHCHNILTQLSDEEVDRSVVRSKQLLESWTGKVVDCFAYPNGNYDERVARIVRGAGFKCALATEPRPWRRDDPLFAIPRISIGRYDSLEQFKIKLLGGIKQLLPWRPEAGQ